MHIQYLFRKFAIIISKSHIMLEKRRIIFLKRAAYVLSAILFVSLAFTVYANIKVENTVRNRIYASIEEIPHNKVALLLGTNPLNRLGRPNSYFINRINTAAELFHADKVDFIIASGDNHTSQYDEPTAMRDSLIAHGVPEERIILDFAGFRTLDSVVRAKKVFGCDSITIVSQDDHNARALYIAEACGLEAVAISAPLRASRRVRIRLAIREWLARDKMMLDLWFGKQPHFLGERITIPQALLQKSRSTADGMTMIIVEPEIIKMPLDSFVVEFKNDRKENGLTGEWFRIEKLSTDGLWEELPVDRKYENTDGEVAIMFNDVGIVVFPDSALRLTVKPWFYKTDWEQGTYRISKTFSYPPYPTLRSDTAYVEFQIK